MIVVVLCLMTGISLSDFPGVQGQDPPTISRLKARRVLWISRIAAGDGMQNLSLRAVEQALGAGSPEAGMAESTDEESGPEMAKRLMINEIEADLETLTELWREKQFESEAIWQTLREVVLPKSRPGEIFPYQKHHSGAAPSMNLVDQSVAARLLRHTVAIGKTDELRSLLESRSFQPQSRFDAWLLLLQLSLQSQDSGEMRRQLGQFNAELLTDADSQRQLVLCVTLFRVWEIADVRGAVVPIMESCVQSMLQTRGSVAVDKCISVMALILAREHFLKNDTDAAQRCLQVAEATNSVEGVGEQIPTATITHFVDTANLLLRFGLNSAALSRLKEVIALERLQNVNSLKFASRVTLLTRYLHELPANDRFELLHECFFLDSRLQAPSVEFVGQDRPPDVIVNSIPMTPRKTLLSTPRATPAGALVSSGTLLIDSAKEIGKSESLAAELLKTHQDGQRFSLHMLTLCCLQNGMLDQAVVHLQEIRDGLLKEVAKATAGRDFSMDLLVAIAAAEIPQTRAVAIEMLDALRGIVRTVTAGHVMAHASESRALAIAAETNQDFESLRSKAAPALWLQAENANNAAKQKGHAKSLWLAHDGIITHQTGPDEDSLYFPWPLGGTFEFSVSSLGDVQSNGDLGFDGLTCQIISKSGNTIVAGLGNFNPNHRALRLSQVGAYSRKSVRVTPTQLTFLANGHPVYSEVRSTHNSPWLALSAKGPNIGVWRFPTFSGSPEILREVSMSSDPLMRGWSCYLFGQSRSDVGTNGKGPDLKKISDAGSKRAFDWTWDDGIITGRRMRDARSIDAMMDANLQGLFQYDRPMQSGEKVSWEFHYEPGLDEVHPALGRIAFLMRPGGIRLHWMSVSPDEWTLFPADNELDVPEDRRGPEELPLQIGWNQASLTVQDSSATLSLNGVAVYETALRPQDSRQFGLFHFRDVSAARVRNVVLTGDWPESLTEEHMQRLTMPQVDSLSAAENHTLDRIVGETAFATDASEIVRFAGGLSAEDRYLFLRGWVLPGNTHADWRFYGDFVSHDSMPQGSESPVWKSLLPGSKANAGGTAGASLVVAPMIQLIRAAKETGRLAELRTLVEATPETSINQRQARLAALMLIAIEEDRLDDAATSLRQVNGITKSLTQWTESQLWLPLIVAQQTLGHAKLRADSLDGLRHLVKIQQASKLSSNSARLQFLASLRSVGETLEMNGPGTALTTELRNWQPFRITRADLRSRGLPEPVWVQQADGSIQHVSGFEDDMLCFPVPLLGEFEFECELVPVDGEHLLVGYGGFFLKPTAAATAFPKIPYGRHATVQTKTNPVTIQSDVWKIRLAVTSLGVKIRVNDEELSTDEIPANAPPWLCIRAAGKPGAIIRAMRLTGSPSIPESITLDTGRDLEGWSRPYFSGEEAFTPRNRTATDWRSDEALIVGPQRTVFANAKVESLLRYFRPMLEDGIISYSFFYDPGTVIAHPAVGRMAFVLDGVRGVLTHEVTDGSYDRFGLDPFAAQAEAGYQRVTTLPLLAKDWNTMKLRIDGDTVTLILNDVEIFQRPLSPGNDRTFGLFHFKDESTARVRGVSWHGQWPQSLPVP